MKRETPEEIQQRQATFAAVETEMHQSTRVYRPFKSPHEALGIIREEYLEFEQALFHGSDSDTAEEAIQLAAMALKYLCQLVTPEDLKVAADRCRYKMQRRLERKTTAEGLD